MGLTEATRTWRGPLRLGRQDHGDFCGLGQSLPLRFCFDGLHRAGQIPGGLGCQWEFGAASQVTAAILRLKGTNRPAVTSLGSLALLRLALHGFRNSSSCNPAGLYCAEDSAFVTRSLLSILSQAFHGPPSSEPPIPHKLVTTSGI